MCFGNCFIFHVLLSHDPTHPVPLLFFFLFALLFTFNGSARTSQLQQSSSEFTVLSINNVKKKISQKAQSYVKTTHFSFMSHNLHLSWLTASS